MCYFLPPPPAVYCFSHVSADTSSALSFCRICRGAHPKEEAQGKQGDPNLGLEGMGGDGHCRAWVRESRSTGVTEWEPGWKEHKNREAWVCSLERGKPSLEIWRKHETSVGKQDSA